MQHDVAYTRRGCFLLTIELKPCILAGQAECRASKRVADSCRMTAPGDGTARHLVGSSLSDEGREDEHGGCSSVREVARGCSE